MPHQGRTWRKTDFDFNLGNYVQIVFEQEWGEVAA